VVKVGEDRSRAQPGVCQALQHEQDRFQPILARRGGQAMMPGVGFLLQHLAGVGGRSGPSLRR
jgi:hypothetical protein